MVRKIDVTAHGEFNFASVGASQDGEQECERVTFDDDVGCAIGLGQCAIGQHRNRRSPLRVGGDKGDRPGTGELREALRKGSGRIGVGEKLINGVHCPTRFDVM